MEHKMAHSPKKIKKKKDKKEGKRLKKKRVMDGDKRERG